MHCRWRESQQHICTTARHAAARAFFRQSRRLYDLDSNEELPRSIVLPALESSDDPPVVAFSDPSFSVDAPGDLNATELSISLPTNTSTTFFEEDVSDFVTTPDVSSLTVSETTPSGMLLAGCIATTHKALLQQFDY
jgi:TFIIF-interacting CTD phosphatase-like protein